MLRCMDHHIKQNKNKNTHKVGHMTRNYWSHALLGRNQIDKKKKKKNKLEIKVNKINKIKISNK